MTPITRPFGEHPPSPATPFDSWGHRQKLLRADTQIAQALTAIDAWVQDGGYRTFDEPDGAGNAHVQAEMVKPLPEDLSVIIGDALQNLRNSLDNLVFSLALDNRGTLSPVEERGISFPISDSAVPTNSLSIQLLSQGAITDICSLAPDPARLALNHDPLWLLNGTANRDKHRTILVAAGAVTSAGAIFRPSGSGGRGGGLYFGAPSGAFERMSLGGPPVSIGTIYANAPAEVEPRHRMQIRFDGNIEGKGSRRSQHTLDVPRSHPGRHFHDS